MGPQPAAGLLESLFSGSGQTVAPSGRDRGGTYGNSNTNNIPSHSFQSSSKSIFSDRCRIFTFLHAVPASQAPWLLANSYQGPPQMSPPGIFSSLFLARHPTHLGASVGPHRSVCILVGFLTWSMTKQLFIGTCYLPRHCILICTGFYVSHQLRRQEPCLMESIRHGLSKPLPQCLTGCPAPSEAKECWVLESGPAGSQFQLHRLRTAALWQIA